MATVFERLHHQRIATVLSTLDADVLRQHACWFGGGTAIVLRQGEYRESVDIDFLVSELSGYRGLRQLLTGPDGILALAATRTPPWQPAREVRADQYGLRTALDAGGERPIKFEVVLEGRIPFDLPAPEDNICGVATLTRGDMVASKLLANTDRWADDGVFSRDMIDLAMLRPERRIWKAALAKAEEAYGNSVRQAVAKAMQHLRNRPERLARCMHAMQMTVPKAVLWQGMRRIEKLAAEPPDPA